MVQARGRWQSTRTMQIYVQELVASSFFASLPADTRGVVLELARLAPKIAEAALQLLDEQANHTQWFRRMSEIEKLPSELGALAGYAPVGALGDRD